MIEDSHSLEALGLELVVGKENRIFRRKETYRKKIFKVHYGKSPCVLFFVWQEILKDGWIDKQSLQKAKVEHFL